MTEQQLAASLIVLAFAVALLVLGALSERVTAWWERRHPEVRLLPDCPVEPGNDPDANGAVCPEALLCADFHVGEPDGPPYICPTHHPDDVLQCDWFGWHCAEHQHECGGCAAIAQEDALIDRADAMRKGEWF